MTRSLPAAYFERLYAEKPDPWDFATSAYERDKYAASLAALPPGQFGSAFEIGCSIGIFTRRLAPRCGRLLAIDIARAPLERARRHCEGLPNILFRRMRIPAEWPEDRFDLTVFSEVLYYLSEEDIALTARKALRTRAPGGLLLLVHWLGPTDYPATGDEAATLFQQETRLSALRSERTPHYRLDLLG